MKTTRLSNSGVLRKGTTSKSFDRLRINSLCRGRCVRKLGSSADKNGSTLQNAQHPHEGFVTHQLIEQFLVASVEDDFYYLEQGLQFFDLF